jgi:lipopolysaccharide export system protein LptA
MRSLRWLLLAAIVLIAAAVAGIYHSRRVEQRSARPPAPAAIPLDTKTSAKDFEWGQSANGMPAAKGRARSVKESADGSRVEYYDLELDIYQKDGRHYDSVKSAYAQLSTADHKLYSPGDAQITIDVPSTGAPPHQLTSVTTAGINFDSLSGQAITDHHVAFTFESGNGTATGATYDPSTHALNFLHDVTLNLNGDGPNSKPMKVETDQLAWNENTGVLVLSPWSRLTRDHTIVNAGQSTVLLKDKHITSIDAAATHGTDTQPSREIDYSADTVHVEYNDEHLMDKVTGTGNAKLISHSTGSVTTMTGNRVDLALTGHSILSTATATGNGYLESKPAPDPKGNTGDTKIIRSDILDLKMKPGGKELERVNTQAAGTLEFLPSQAARHRRLLKADRMVISYGERNEIQSFKASQVSTPPSTETYPSEEERQKKKQGLATAFTSSKSIDATFDDAGQLKFMRQQDDFHYTEGDRKAQADSATLQNDTNVMDLDRNARISDASGSTSADHIQMHQATGDFDARGHASTTRLPESNKSESAMLDKGEATLGTADRVTSANRNTQIHYIGNAAVWQTSNRIQGDRIDIDRDKKSLIADGHVTTEFLDKPKADGADAQAKPAQPTFTIVKAPHLVYTDLDRLATYQGGTDFWRPALTVKSTTLKAWLNPDDSDSDSRINHTFADGKVEIVQFVPADHRQRVGNSEHAEYYTEEGKIILTGGEPQLSDSKRGNTKGDKLTYYTDPNRLEVNGAQEKKVQVQSHLRKKS